MFTHGALIQDVSALEFVISSSSDVVLVLVGAPPTTPAHFLFTLKFMFHGREDDALRLSL